MVRVISIALLALSSQVFADAHVTAEQHQLDDYLHTHGVGSEHFVHSHSDNPKYPTHEHDDEILSSNKTGSVIPQQQKDLIREYYIENILQIKPSDANISQDIREVRKLFKQEFAVDERRYPDFREEPNVRVLNAKKITLGRLMSLVGKSSNYTVFVDDLVNLDQMVSLNERFNSLESLGLYLDRVTDATVVVATESSTIMVLPGIKGK